MARPGATRDRAEASPTRDAMLQRARALVPAIRERAPEAEALRRLPEATVRDLHDTGLWRINQPARVGGPQLDYRLLVEISSEFARACGSTGWVFVNLAVHHWMLGMWPAVGQDHVWGEDPDALIASAVIYPCGQARMAGDRYLLTGRWPFCSGIMHSEWAMVGALVRNDNAPDAPPESRMFLVPKSGLDVIDTWNVAGLAATGSHDVACRDLEVAAYMTVGAREVRGDLTPGSAVNPGPLYRQSVAALFPHLIASIVLGMAQDMYDQTIERFSAGTSMSNRSRIADHGTIQSRVAEAGVQIDAARLLLFGGFDESQRLAEAGTVPAVADKLRWRRDGTYAAVLAANAGTALFRAAGGNAIRLSNPMQRHMRDINAALGHFHVNWDANSAAYGRVAMGLPPDNPNI
jgi:3-hydroxy-9,10-secoandrosta-1,3,5(10)-triene-9,17-dione monooxygenase